MWQGNQHGLSYRSSGILVLYSNPLKPVCTSQIKEYSPDLASQPKPWVTDVCTFGGTSKNCCDHIFVVFILLLGSTRIPSLLILVVSDLCLLPSYQDFMPKGIQALSGRQALVWDNQNWNFGIGSLNQKWEFVTFSASAVPSASACSSLGLCLNFMSPNCITAEVHLYKAIFSSFVNPSTAKASCK